MEHLPDGVPKAPYRTDGNGSILIVANERHHSNTNIVITTRIQSHTTPRGLYRPITSR